MIKFKPGIFTKVLTPEVVRAINVAERVFMCVNCDAIVTALEDGKHKNGSLHYSYLAVDFRTRHVKKGYHGWVADEMSRLLGDDYDVVLHKTHLHVEYDPDER